MDIDDLFEQVKQENDPDKYEDAGDKLINRVEKEFKEISPEEIERQNEEVMYKKKIKKLQNQLRKCRNIKNHRFRHLNTERAKKRKEIRKQINQIKLDLGDIQSERKGSCLGSRDIMKKGKNN